MRTDIFYTKSYIIIHKTCLFVKIKKKKYQRAFSGWNSIKINKKVLKSSERYVIMLILLS